MRRFTRCEADKGKKELWVGVDCKGDLENQISIFINKNEMPICELCKNQVRCMFNGSSNKNTFEMKVEYLDIKREKISNWIQSNRTKLKIETKNPQRYIAP